MSTLLVGAGSLGSRVAALLADAGEEVLLLRRRDRALPGTRLIRADLASGEGLHRVPGEVARVIYAVAPDERSEAAYRATYHDGLRRLLDVCTASRWLFVSSTAVYGQDAGEWVDEDSPALAEAFNARVLREAEAELRPLGAGGIALRLSGLYGPERRSGFERLKTQTEAGPQWSNRIHLDDAASAVVHVMGSAAPSPIVIGSDDRPTQAFELLEWWRAREGLPPLPRAQGEVSGKRLSNRRLRESGWVPKYPSFVEGYASLTVAGV